MAAMKERLMPHNEGKACYVTTMKERLIHSKRGCVVLALF